MGHIVISVLGMVAQMERRLIKERQRDGIEKAKAGGIYRGGTQRINRAEMLKRHLSGEPPSAIALSIGGSRMQVYRILQKPDADRSNDRLAPMHEPASRESLGGVVRSHGR